MWLDIVCERVSTAHTAISMEIAVFPVCIMCLEWWCLDLLHSNMMILVALKMALKNHCTWLAAVVSDHVKTT